MSKREVAHCAHERSPLAGRSFARVSIYKATLTVVIALNGSLIGAQLARSGGSCSWEGVCEEIASSACSGADRVGGRLQRESGSSQSAPAQTWRPAAGGRGRKGYDEREIHQ